MRALLVDDEREICTLMSAILTRAGIGSVSANTLTEAREALGSGDFDVFFIDIHLPDGMGYDLLPLVRRKFPGSKVIMISAVDEEAQVANRRGVDHFLPKPFTQRVILDMVQDLHPRSSNNDHHHA